MNKQRRKFISSSLEYLGKALDIIETAKDEEQEAYDNLPESLQYSERGEAMEEILFVLEDIFDSIQTVQDQINEIVEN